ncbi:hypothetical protein C0995_005752 [Termitomyces sp. Mi166|nr:hypothetical protein C0995_005752 [Termitomyces sp. Mi166\
MAVVPTPASETLSLRHAPSISYVVAGDLPTPPLHLHSDMPHQEQEEIHAA